MGARSGVHILQSFCVFPFFMLAMIATRQTIMKKSEEYVISYILYLNLDQGVYEFNQA